MTTSAVQLHNTMSNAVSLLQADRVQKVDKVEHKSVSSDHMCIQRCRPFGCIIYMQHIQVLVPSHLPGRYSYRPINKQIKAPIVVPEANKI